MSSYPSSGDQQVISADGVTPVGHLHCMSCTTPECHHVLGCILDSPDDKDYPYVPPSTPLLGGVKDLRESGYLPPVYHQGEIGSCVANAVAVLYEFDILKLGKAKFLPSRLFMYYAARKNFGVDVNTDVGTTIRNCLKSLSADSQHASCTLRGVCPEADWRYDPTGKADKATHVFPSGSRAAMEPDGNAQLHAQEHHAITYWRIKPDLDDLRHCIEEGYPFAFAIKVLRPFDAAANDQSLQGVISGVPDPKDNGRGHHAVVAVGFDDHKQYFIIQNSWGTGFGDKGFLYMPYGFITDAAWELSDFWTLRSAK